MHKLFYFLSFLFLGSYCVSQEIEKLPVKPWEELVEMNNNENYLNKKWEKDIKVKLEGSYTKEDSLYVKDILKKFDSLTETISIKFSNSRFSNFKIRFKDSILSDIYDRNSYAYFDNDESYSRVRVSIYKKHNDNLQLKNFVEARFASFLIGGRFEYSRTKRHSIFNPYFGHGNNNIPLNNEDLSIIKEVYKKGFSERLVRAENQFKYVLDDIKEYKIAQRRHSIWWVKNPIAVIFLPTLFLVLFFIFLIDKAKNTIHLKIKSDWFRFNILAFVALLFAGVIIIFCISFFDFLTIPNNYSKVPIVRKDTILSTIAALVPLFPFLFLFRYIEFKIQKSSQNIFIKTILVFLSTGVLPFLCITIAFLFALKEKGDLQGGLFFMSQVFLVLMSVASLRALISYFIFKERNLIIDNEKKLFNLRELKSKAELKSLQSQINPHFLYNSLNSIASLAPIDAAKAQKMAHSLSDLFKYSINRKGKEMSTVKEEIDMVKSYLDIEKIRFGDRLQFEIEVNEMLLNNEIPLFLIQPLVENAVKHGISQNEGKGNILLKIEKNENELNISVSDNGPDFPEGLVSGHGLQTVYDLLRLSYEDKASLNWRNTPKKIITITIPESI